MLSWLLPWRRRRARREGQRALAAAAAEQEREREAARQRLLYDARAGHHWRDAPTKPYPSLRRLMRGQQGRGRGGRS